MKTYHKADGAEKELLLGCIVVKAFLIIKFDKTNIAGKRSLVFVRKRNKLWHKRM